MQILVLEPCGLHRKEDIDATMRVLALVLNKQMFRIYFADFTL